MEKITKQTYIVPEIKVIRFQVEQGFAGASRLDNSRTPLTTNDVNCFQTEVIGSEAGGTFDIDWN